MKISLLVGAVCLFVFPVFATGQNAAPSSHMVYNDASFAGDILINEVRVPKNGEATYTYYEALGWSGKGAGYAGIQAHPKAHNYIFSIWDHKAHSAPIKAVYRGPGTLTENFGGEGTGLKSWNFELGWDTDVWYTLVARCWPVGDHTYYGYWVRSDKTGEWTHMVTMDVAAKDALLVGGNDSFIEDWLDTGKNVRTSHVRNGWKRNPNGKWHAFTTAKYSVNSWDLVEGKRSFNFKTNWNGGVAKDKTGSYYFMTTGGRTTKAATTNPASLSIKRSEKQPNYASIKLQSGKWRAAGDGKYLATWKIDSTTLPQFSYTITVYDNTEGQPKRLVQQHTIEPHARTVELNLAKDLDPKNLRWRLQCHDILGNESAVMQLQMSEFAPVKEQ